jgi:nicotinamidase-related amidase
MSTFKYNRLDKNNAAVLLVDHQTGLFSLVRDIAILNDYTRYQALPGNAYPEALPP